MGSCCLEAAVLLKRHFTYENCFSNFLRNLFLEVLWVANCERLYNKDSLTLSVYLSVSVCLPVCLPVCLSFCLSVSLSLSSLSHRSTKNLIFNWQQNSCSEKIQRHLFTDVLQKRCFLKFREIPRKTPALELLFNAVTGIRLTPAQVFSCELIEILRTSILQNTFGLEK